MNGKRGGDGDGRRGGDIRDRRALVGYGAVVFGLHALGLSLWVSAAGGGPAGMLGLGMSAYLLGLRHAFDADHIAAVDDTVRLLVQRGRRPLGAGFYFSLGHSSVVFALVLASASFARSARAYLPGLQHFGDLFGPLLSGGFLCWVGALNLVILLKMLRLWQGRGGGRGPSPHRHAPLDELMAPRGLLRRLLGGRLFQSIGHSWQMYPVGFLFGLGFDSASEVTLLAMSGVAAAGRISVAGVLALPVLFAAAMSLVDTADGVVMTHAYGWALDNPARRLLYNLATTALSVAVALGIGTLELVQLLIAQLRLHGRLAQALASFAFDRLGFVIVATFLLGWGLSYAYARWRMVAARAAPRAG